MGLLLARSLAVAFSTNSYCKSMQIKTLSYWKAVIFGKICFIL